MTGRAMSGRCAMPPSGPLSWPTAMPIASRISRCPAGRKRRALSDARRHVQPRPARKADDRARAQDAPFQYLACGRPSSASAAARFTGAWKSMDFRRRFEFGLAWRTLVLIAAICAVRRGDVDARTCAPARLVAALIVAFAALASLWKFIRRTNFQVVALHRIGAIRGLFAAFLGPQRRRVRRARRDAGCRLEDASGAAHRRHRAKRDISSAIVDDARARCSPSTRTAGSRCSTRRRGRSVARHQLRRRRGSRSLGPEVAGRGPTAAGNAQDHAADDRRRSATGDLRLGACGAPGQAGDRLVDPAGAERTRCAGSRGAGRFGPRADPRNHELADAGDIACPLGRGNGRRRQPKAPIWARRGSQPRPSPAAPKAYPLRRKLSRVRAGARSASPRLSAKPWCEEILRLAWRAPRSARSTPRLEVEPQTLKLNADPELLAQALLNLLRNAIRVTAEVADPIIVLDNRARAARAVTGSRSATMARAFPRSGATTSSCPSTPRIRAAAASASALRGRSRWRTAVRSVPGMRPKAAHRYG